jgi:hypothetical protein
MDTVTRLPSSESLLEEVDGWAVKAHDNLSLFRHKAYERLNERKPAWGVAHINPIEYGMKVFYASGFHVFRNESSAWDYLKDNFTDHTDHTNHHVVHVHGQGILAEGLQTNRSIVVVLELEMLLP